MTPTEFAVKTLYWFFLYGFIGWGVEVVYAAIKTHKLVNRGFLCGPICPIYGFGMVGLIYSVSLIPMPDSGSMSSVAIFFIGMILTTAIELVGGWALFKIYHIRWWDYSNCKYQINGRICLTNCIFFGLGCVLLCHVVNPPVLRWLMGIGPEYTVPVASFIFGLYIMDNVLSIRSAFQLSHRLDKLQKLQQEIRQHLDEKAQLYGNRVEELTVRLMNGLEKASDEYLQERMLRLAQLRSGADVFERRLLRSHPNLRSKRHGKLIDVLRQKKDGVVKK